MAPIPLDANIRLAHGNGGRHMRELIESVFARHLPSVDVHSDAAALTLPPGEIVVSTDGFTVQPLEFPGGDIGQLAVHGTVNDLAVVGALPQTLTLSVLVEEGFSIARLDRLVASFAAAARAAGVTTAAGDTKVLRHGEGGGVYLTTTGIGVRRPGTRLGIDQIRPGDAVLVSGPVGDHGAAVLLAREEYGLASTLVSDCASVVELAQALLELPGLRFMRDPTRGGVATVLHEIAHASGLGLHLDEAATPIRPQVRTLCDLLGFDPLYLACEGRVVAVVDPAFAESALRRWQALPAGRQAALIGCVTSASTDPVVLQTELGGERVLDELEDDPLPRIC